jgi:hypothetical protein
MTEEQINIAIAESQGISDCIVRNQEHVNVEGREVCFWEELGGYKDGKYYRIPDYANDLNAMREALVSQGDPQFIEEFEHCLIHEVMGGCGWLTLSTAREQAEAYLRTIGRFEDE